MRINNGTPGLSRAVNNLCIGLAFCTLLGGAACVKPYPSASDLADEMIASPSIPTAEALVKRRNTKAIRRCLQEGDWQVKSYVAMALRGPVDPSLAKDLFQALDLTGPVPQERHLEFQRTGAREEIATAMANLGADALPYVEELHAKWGTVGRELAWKAVEEMTFYKPKDLIGFIPWIRKSFLATQGRSRDIALSAIHRFSFDIPTYKSSIAPGDQAWLKRLARS